MLYTLVLLLCILQTTLAQEVTFVNGSPDGDSQSMVITSYYSDTLQEFGASCVAAGGFCDMIMGDRGRPWTLFANLSLTNSSYTSPIRGEVWDDNKRCVFVTDWIVTGPGNVTDLGTINTSNYSGSCIPYTTLSYLVVNRNIQQEAKKKFTPLGSPKRNDLFSVFDSLPSLLKGLKEQEEQRMFPAQKLKTLETPHRLVEYNQDSPVRVN